MLRDSSWEVFAGTIEGDEARLKSRFSELGQFKLDIEPDQTGLSRIQPDQAGSNQMKLAIDREITSADPELNLPG
eukprot:5399304-Pyramimonas_sp.AAC.1